ncbi:Asp23/Gls24 family envelope stress response protein [Nocardia sp. NPDC057668]|uniref:Asp23/Gls24 family envelope stress response protein n=1 Tax=Nocardia sp. NPDC057668 TaxID=3346202 RepID=UPI00366C4210
MAVNSTTGHDQGHRLPCGRDLDLVWERLDLIMNGSGDEHDTGCPHCVVAGESLLKLRAATKALTEEPDPAPPDLSRRIMSAVRAEARRTRTLPLPSAQPGGVEISTQAVAAVVRYVADSVPGVRARGCRIRATRNPADSANLLTIELYVAIGIGRTTTAEATPLVRARVSSALDAQLGLELASLTITVADIYHENESGR